MKSVLQPILDSYLKRFAKAVIARNSKEEQICLSMLSVLSPDHYAAAIRVKKRHTGNK